MAAERGIEVVHTTIMRWLLKFSKPIEKAARKLKKPTGARYFIDETYILEGLVDLAGNVVSLFFACRKPFPLKSGICPVS